MLMALRNLAKKDAVARESLLTLTLLQKILLMVKAPTTVLLASPKTIMKKPRPENSEVVRTREDPDLHVSPVSLKKVRRLDPLVNVSQESPVTLMHPTFPAYTTNNVHMESLLSKDPLVSNKTEITATTSTEVTSVAWKVSLEAAEVVTVVAKTVVLVESTVADTAALRAKPKAATLITRDSQDVKVTTRTEVAREAALVSPTVVAQPEEANPSTESSKKTNELTLHL